MFKKLNRKEGGRMAKYDYSKLIGRIIEKYGNRQNFAKSVGISATSVTLKLKGKSNFSQRHIIKWAEALDIQPAEYSKYFFAIDVKET